MFTLQRSGREDDVNAPCCIPFSSRRRQSTIRMKYRTRRCSRQEDAKLDVLVVVVFSDDSTRMYLYIGGNRVCF
jgi:hypothetical protein